MHRVSGDQSLWQQGGVATTLLSKKAMQILVRVLFPLALGLEICQIKGQRFFISNPIPIKHTRSHRVYAFSPQAKFDTKLFSSQKVQLFYQFVSTSTTGVLVTNIMYTPDKM